MNIRPSRGTAVVFANTASPNLGPFRKSLFLAVGMLVPASTGAASAMTEEHPNYVHRCRPPRGDQGRSRGL